MSNAHQAAIDKDASEREVAAHVASFAGLKCPFCGIADLFVHPPRVRFGLNWWTVGCDSRTCNSCWSLSLDTYEQVMGKIQHAQPDKPAEPSKSTREQWVLGRDINGHTLKDGQQWHRQDWTQGTLHGGWRPLVMGELREPSDQIYGLLGGGPWIAYSSVHTPDTYARRGSIHTRTLRPLP